MIKIIGGKKTSNVMHLKNDCKQTEIWKVLTEFLREHFVSEWATYYIIYL